MPLCSPNHSNTCPNTNILVKPIKQFLQHWNLLNLSMHLRPFFRCPHALSSSGPEAKRRNLTLCMPNIISSNHYGWTAFNNVCRGHVMLLWACETGVRGETSIFFDKLKRASVENLSGTMGHPCLRLLPCFPSKCVRSECSPSQTLCRSRKHEQSIPVKKTITIITSSLV